MDRTNVVSKRLPRDKGLSRIGFKCVQYTAVLICIIHTHTHISSGKDKLASVNCTCTQREVHYHSQNIKLINNVWFEWLVW